MVARVVKESCWLAGDADDAAVVTRRVASSSLTDLLDFEATQEVLTNLTTEVCSKAAVKPWRPLQAAQPML